MKIELLGFLPALFILLLILGHDPVAGVHSMGEQLWYGFKQLCLILFAIAFLGSIVAAFMWGLSGLV